MNMLSSVRAWALKNKFPWCPTKGGVGIWRTKGDASACPSRGIVKVVVSPAEGQVVHTPPQCVT